MSLRQRAGVCLLATAGLLAALARLPVTSADLDPVRTSAEAYDVAGTRPAVPDAPGTTQPLVVQPDRLARVVDFRRGSPDEIPYPALRAYLRAAQVLAEARPQCRLGWPLLAAVGRVESDHGRAGDAQLHPDGVSAPTLVGPPLDGRGGLAPVPDSDGGRLDGDPTWDRAVGPMQIVPATWTLIGVDGDGDGVRSPADIDDAALAVGVHLCSAGSALDTPAGMRDALHRYNAAGGYAGLVLFYERLYRATEDATAATVAPTALAVRATPVVEQVQARTARLARHPAAVARASNTHPMLAAARPEPTPAETAAVAAAMAAEPAAGPGSGPSAASPVASAPVEDPVPTAAEPATGATSAGTTGSTATSGPSTDTATGSGTSAGDPGPTTTPEPTPEPTGTPDPTPETTATPDPTPDATACPVDGTAPTDPAPADTAPTDPAADPTPATAPDACPAPSAPSDPAPTDASTSATAGDSREVSPSSPAAP
jgi:hypothetical protein